MFTTAYLTPRPQWRLINLTWLRTQAGTNRTAAALLRAADAELADLAEQVDLGLMRVVNADTGAPVQAGDLKRADEQRMRVSLTPRGVAWVRANPHNRVLYALMRFDPARVRVTRVLDIAQVDTIDLRMVVDAGLVLLTPGQFEDAALTSGTQVSTALGSARSRFFCALTCAGRQLVDPS